MSDDELRAEYERGWKRGHERGMVEADARVSGGTCPEELPETLVDALFNIADDYGADVTNNEPRVVDGTNLRHVGDFIRDVTAAFEGFGWTREPTSLHQPPSLALIHEEGEFRNRAVDKSTAGDTFGRVEQAIYDAVMDHPMWIGDDGQPLEYLSAREALIGDFIQKAAAAVMETLA